MQQLDVVEIIKKVQRIQIVANKAVNDLFAGQYKSVFRGRGMEFDEVREYQPGDDVRSIDWNVTARSGVPHIKRFCEERELTILFLVDISASGVFGSVQQSKLDTTVETAAMLMFSALKNNDKVGLLTFCDDVIDYFPPRKGKANVLRLIRHLVSVEPVARETNLDAALEFLSRVQRRRVVAFMVSDFLATPADHAMAVAGRRHDLIALTVSDPRELELPDVGFVTLQDAETGELVELDTRHPEVRALFRQRAVAQSQAIDEHFRRAQVDRLPISTEGDYAKSLQGFFRAREKRFR